MAHTNVSLRLMDGIAIEQQFRDAIRSLSACEAILLHGDIALDDVLVDLLSHRCFFYEYNLKQLRDENK